MGNILAILAAEDEESDAYLLKRAFESAGSKDTLIVVHDGQQAVEYLAGAGPFADRGAYPFPTLMLLDLKMPRMSGFDVLSWLGNHPECQVPTVVLTSSSHEEDMQRARQLGAADYLVKPHGFSELVKLVESVSERWLKNRELPRQNC